MISVIIPAFDEEKVIEGCIKQFLAFKKKFRQNSSALEAKLVK